MTVKSELTLAENLFEDTVGTTRHRVSAGVKQHALPYWVNIY